MVKTTLMQMSKYLTQNSNMYNQTPRLHQLGADDKIALIYAIDMALRNAENPIVIKKFEKMRSKLLLTQKGKERKVRV